MYLYFESIFGRIRWDNLILGNTKTTDIGILCRRERGQPGCHVYVGLAFFIVSYVVQAKSRMSDIIFIHRSPSIQPRMLRAMGFLSYQSWLLTAALTLATLLAVRTALWTGSRDEPTSRRRQELEVLFGLTDDDNDLSPTARRSKHAVECVFVSQSFTHISM